MPNDEQVAPDDWASALEASWSKVEAPPAPVEPTAATQAATEATPAVTTEAPAEGRQRGPDGKFIAKSDGAGKGNPAPSSSPPEAQAGADLPPAPPAPVVEALKPPQSWTPAEREGFAKAPPEVQKAALRREREIQTALQEAAGGKELKQAIAPYEQLFRQSGVNAPQAVGNVMQTYAALHTGSPQVKAQILAKLVGDFMGKNEASYKLLADALDGTAAPTPQAVGPDQIREMVQAQLQEERAKADNARTATTWQQFEATAPEHLQTVLPEMLALADAWRLKNPGQAPGLDNLKKFHERALLLNEETSALIQQRKATEAAATVNAATQRAKAASVSIKSQPAGPSAPPALGDDTRAHMAAAWDRVAGQ